MHIGRLALTLGWFRGKVIIADLNEEAGSKFAAELNEKAGSSVAVAYKVDTTNWDDQAAAFEKGKATFGRIDYVFANAGIAELPWLPAFDPATAANRPISKPNFATLNIDCTGQLNTAALALQYFERQEKGVNGFRGKLILTSSVIGFYPSTTMPMYSAAKAAIVNFMRASAAFYADKDVTINCSKS
ncbi:NAD(P)-binding protein [Punctularia strigosozonata HHB-11173 SS5]|uniref:NAD(P)-binding protein n=1 Tax=Punctularia strigosozonata (strain HHB-11173) TaxID=741275 RepID=UPI0004417BBC|nr:NAD(P)-binding protein [Punctularia strigosozonata HHB-11173 SS5]EIN06675.1 NAD(P)-binding protein [Punctularia strigosozonata HHB-11173 SS5]